MVKKLFKHECLAFLRILLPVECVVAALAVFTRILLFFESESVIYSLILGGAIFMFVLSLFVGSIACFWVAITRFYKNLFTGEGYLSFTLPVTPAQHLLVKLGTAVLMDVGALAVGIFAVILVCSGDVLTEVLKAAAYLLDKLFTVVPATHCVLYIVEVLLLLLISRIYSYLLVYGCICIGQTFRKNRVLGAFGIYFGYTMILQALGTAFSILLTVVDEAGWMAALGTFIETHTLGVIHAAFCGSGVLSLLIAAVFFFVSHHIMCKKLNLE